MGLSLEDKMLYTVRLRFPNDTVTVGDTNYIWKGKPGRIIVIRRNEGLGTSIQLEEMSMEDLEERLNQKEQFLNQFE